MSEAPQPDHHVPAAPAALRQRLRQLQQAGALSAHSPRPLPSPCINVCRMDAAQHYCLGCLRTLDELCAWGSSSPAQQRLIWQRIAQRCDTANPTA